MTLSPELKKKAKLALEIRDSQVPLHRVIDILATDEGDISLAISRFRDIKNKELRRAFHYCAELLREIEKEAGLTPAWEAGLRDQPAPKETAKSDSASTETKPAAEKTKKGKFAPEDLQNFVDEKAVGNVRTAKMYTDGASKGNPGDSGIGVALMTMEGQKIGQISRYIGLATNNIAEYTALIEGLKLAVQMQIKVINCIADSELVVKQVNGLYKIKNPDILKKVQEVMALRKNFEKFSISYVGREHNTLADALSTASIPSKKKATAPKSEKKTEEPQEEPYKDVMGKLDIVLDEGSTE